MNNEQDIQKILASIAFMFSGLFFILGYASAYNMILLNESLISIIKSVSPTISAGIVFIYFGFFILHAHKWKNPREINKKTALRHFVFIFIGSIIAIVGFMEEIWGLCSLGFFLTSVSLIEIYIKQHYYKKFLKR